MTTAQYQPVHGEGWSVVMAPDGTTTTLSAACEISTRAAMTAFNCDCGAVRGDAPCEHFHHHFSRREELARTSGDDSPDWTFFLLTFLVFKVVYLALKFVVPW